MQIMQYCKSNNQKNASQFNIMNDAQDGLREPGFANKDNSLSGNVALLIQFFLQMVCTNRNQKTHRLAIVDRRIATIFALCTFLTVWVLKKESSKGERAGESSTADC